MSKVSINACGLVDEYAQSHKFTPPDEQSDAYRVVQLLLERDYVAYQ